MESWSLPSEIKGYGLIAELACGGMATVYAARKVAAAGFERLVVIKRLHPHLTVDEEARALFRDEARFGAMLRHPNVVPVIDVVEAGDEILLVQPYVESVTLAQLLKSALRAGRLTPPDIGLRIVCDVLSGLHEAHEAKDLKGESLHLVHRDLSPQNILVAVDGSSRLIDFGVSKAAGAIDPQGMALRGKFPYLSPEQVNGLSLDRRADLFTAGSLLFEVLTGRRLFSGNDPSETMMKILAADIPRPSSMIETLPSAIDEVVVRALQRDRADRFQTAVEMIDALEAAVAPATHREVSLWLQELLGDVLAERRELLQDSFALQQGGDDKAAAGAAEQPAGDSALFGSSATPVSLGRFRLYRSAVMAGMVVVAVVFLIAVWYAGTRSGAESVKKPRAIPVESPRATPISRPHATGGAPSATAPIESRAAVGHGAAVKSAPAPESAVNKGRAVSGKKDSPPQPSGVSNQNAVIDSPQPVRDPSERALHDLPSIASEASSPSIGEETATDDQASARPALHDNPYAR